MKVKVKKNTSVCKTMQKLLEKLDLFGRNMDSEHNYANKKLFKSLFGTVLSIIFVGLVLNYAFYKFENMIEVTDTNITTS